MKQSISNLTEQYSGLASQFNALTERVHENETTALLRSRGIEDIDQEASEFMRDSLSELDQSLDNGDIDMEQYAASLQDVLGTAISRNGKLNKLPMTSTPPPHSSKTAAAPPSHIHISGSSYARSPSAKKTKRFTREHSKTPIKRQSPAKPKFFASTPNNKNSTPKKFASSVTKQESLIMSTPKESTENTPNLLPRGTYKVPVAMKTHETHKLNVMEMITEQEKANVQLWLGLDMEELNRAIPLLNELAIHQQKDGVASASFTIEEVAAQCGVEPKRAKAIVLLLCNLNRLRLVRGEITKYVLHKGSTVVSTTAK